MTSPSLSGVQLQLFAGSSHLPAPEKIMRAIQRLEISESTDAPAVFQIILAAGHGTQLGSDDWILSHRALAAFSPISVCVRVGGTAIVLFNGVITHRQLVAGGERGEMVVALTGEDMTLFMDLEQRITSHPAMSESDIARTLLLRYGQHGVLPRVFQPAKIDRPSPAERVPIQHGTDLAHLRLMAARLNLVFVVRPGPLPFISDGYFGPAKGLAGMPLPPLSTGTDSPSDVSEISFEHDALAVVRVTGQVTDSRSDRSVPVIASPLPISAAAGVLTPARRSVLTRDSGGLTAPAAQARAQASADASSEAVVVATGNLDVAGYGSVLQPHRQVGVRGAGATFNGVYRVDAVTHLINPGGYRQQFRLVRSGTGTTTPVLTGFTGRGR